MRIVFMGTPDFAVPTLAKLAGEHEVVCVYTQAPKEAGRGHKILKSPVQVFAEEHGLEVRTPKSLRSPEEQARFASLNADAAVVAAYGLILPPSVLRAFPKGCLNVHASLLPRWRGAAPIQRAIEAGDEKSGVTIMQVEEGLDTGAMFLKGEVVLDEETTGGVLHDRLAEIGAELMFKVLADYERISPQVQDEGKSCYAPKIDKSECRLDFTKPAAVLERKIRAFNPYPAMYFEYEGERFKVLRAEALDAESGMIPGALVPNDSGLLIACGKGMLLVTEIQRQGKKAMPTEELLRGFSFKDDAVLS